MSIMARASLLLKTGGGRLQDGIAAGIAAGATSLVWNMYVDSFAASVVMGFAVLLVLCFAMRRYNQKRRTDPEVGRRLTE